jgi:hypothetical protein
MPLIVVLDRFNGLLKRKTGLTAGVSQMNADQNGRNFLTLIRAHQR